MVHQRTGPEHKNKENRTKMGRKQYLAMLVMVLGIVSVALGATFIGLSAQKNNYVTNELRQQNVTVGLTKEQIANGEIVDNARKAQLAAETIAKHLQNIAPTYNDLMALNPSGKYDPANPTDLKYTQGLNMENSFNIAVLSFGVIQQTIATGIALVIIGIAVGATGFMFSRLDKKEA
jgi:uncharacterized membrane protein